MIKLQDKIQQVIDTFYKSTGIGILFFDKKLTVTMHQNSKRLVNDFICLGMSRITSFLAEKYHSEANDENIFYTFILDANLVSNVILLCHEGSWVGAFVTQPVLINKPRKEDMEKLLDNLNIRAENRKTVSGILMRTPVVSYDRIMPVGYVLKGLLSTFFTEDTPRQVLKGGSDVSTAKKIDVVKNCSVNRDALTTYNPYSSYLTIKESIQRGDTDALSTFMNEINAGSIPMDTLHDSNFIRSLKNNCIKVCSMGCYAAVEANAPYFKTLNLADEFIRKAEALENINDIYELMKNAMLSFTRSVAAGKKISYSKPIRLVIEYIEGHYAEKITLNVLAEHTNLSASYLSNMIKKETGMNLLDNINKIRIEHSKRLLLETNLSSNEVASKVGFSYQNHFASTFRKITGLTPSDFRKLTYLGNEPKSDKVIENEIMPLIFEQLRGKLSVLNSMYDIVRIVDPIRNVSWIISDDNEEIIKGTCYDFWGKNEHCRNCISTMAYLHNDTFFKIDRQNENTFLVLAAPKLISKNIYVIELLKNVTGNFYMNDESGLLTDIHKDIVYKDELTGLYDRQYIDKNLPVYFRRSKLENKPFSIIVSIIDIYDRVNNQYYCGGNDEILSEYAEAITDSLESSEHWAGIYAGNIFLTVLSNTDYDCARRIGKNIEENFSRAVSKLNKDDLRISSRYSVKSCTDDIHDAEALIRCACINLSDNRMYSLPAAHKI